MTGAMTWRQFRVLVEELPQQSRLVRAVHGELAGWTPEAAVLADVFDVLAAANWQRAGKAGAPRPKPYPRPGLERSRDREHMSRQLRRFQQRHPTGKGGGSDGG